jgi:hypothetical protein
MEVRTGSGVDMACREDMWSVKRKFDVLTTLLHPELQREVVASSHDIYMI